MKRQRTIVTFLAALLGLVVSGPVTFAGDDTIKIGYIDPFSGAFAAGGDASLKEFRSFWITSTPKVARSARSLN
jgi:hypothetical protein